VLFGSEANPRHGHRKTSGIWTHYFLKQWQIDKEQGQQTMK